MRRSHLLPAALLLLTTAACSGGGPGTEAAEAGDLAAQAGITEDAARATALGRVPGGEIRSAELEEEDGRLIYSFDIAVEGASGVQEVQVDATDGSVVGVEHESAEREAEEAGDEDGASPMAAPR
jgi:hypothetical protein